MRYKDLTAEDRSKYRISLSRGLYSLLNRASHWTSLLNDLLRAQSY